MSCPYEYYKNGKEYYPRLFCNIDDTQCIYTKRCDKVEKFIPLDNQKECYKYNMEMQKNIPSGSNFVQTYRPNKKGELYLYVVVNDKIEKIPSKLTELNQNYVYLKKGINGYEVSLTPFEKVTTTRTYNKKKTNAYEN
jgi:hypothetical protein